MALTEGWAAQEMRGARLDHPRRRRNLILICEKLLQQAGKSLSAALGDATRQAAFDLFSRAKRTVDDLIAGHVAETCARCTATPGPILVVQDNVRLDYFTHRGCAGLGPVGNSPTSYGLWGHSALALRADGLPLGVLTLHFWARDPERYGQRQERDHRPAAEKESHIWAQTLTRVEAVLSPEAPVILIQDREADLYAFLTHPRRPTTDLIVRAFQARRARVLSGGGPDTAADPTPTSLATAEPSAWGSLLDVWSHAPVQVAERTVEIAERPARPQTPAQPARTARVEVRSARVELAPPQTREGRKAPGSRVFWAVWLRELNPPAEQEGLNWVLLTTLEAATPAAAERVLDLYMRRWMIERLHRVLKSGLKVERFQIDDAASLQNALALCWVVAWQLLRLTEVARADPNAAAGAWLVREELAVLTAVSGEAPRTLREALRQVAKFGGWPGATRNQDPGTDVLWRGLRDLAVATRVWRLARPGGSSNDTS